MRVVVRAAAGRGEVPAGPPAGPLDLVHRRALPPRGLALRGLSERETQVLRLVADGHDTAEIAGLLCYSERTVKNVLHAVTSRLQLRNRSHAVAYALREGLI
ncbi:response regulator transcription factor [Modestobacter marinus]|uniref:response regulator transcription factor n=1 Tax=Modestobacter marinus TaxID=477641 RepID=UPI001C96F51B|nr:helix-turn-helix transcriptional regulator [Modestobacter marinus]